MATNYTDIAQEILTKIDRVERRQKEILRMVSSLYYDEPVDEAEVVQQSKTNVNGPGWEKIHYLVLDEKYTDEIAKFREFIAHVKNSPDIFNDFERDSADMADKRFADVRISKKSSAILFALYRKAYNETWKFPFRNTYLYINRETNDRVWQDEL